MAKFIKLTLPYQTIPRFVNVDNIDFIDPATGSDTGAFIGIGGHDENRCYVVLETPEQILALIDGAQQ